MLDQLTFQTTWRLRINNNNNNNKNTIKQSLDPSKCCHLTQLQSTTSPPARQHTTVNLFHKWSTLHKADLSNFFIIYINQQDAQNCWD